MNGHEYRFDVEVQVHPGRRERVVAGGSLQLVTLRLHDGPGVVDEHGEPSRRPGAFTDLRPGEARELAAQLLGWARHAESLRRETDR